MKTGISSEKLKFVILALAVSTIIGCSSATTPVQADLPENYILTAEGIYINTDLDSITSSESISLQWMREEEKLARDVYLTLYETWGLKVFANIARSEQRHTDAVKSLIDFYEIQDPVVNDQTGVFQNSIFTQLYDSLTSAGSVSLGEALKIGAFIEELDIVDLGEQLDSIVTNENIINVYANLKKGSRNHLRAFIRNLTANGITYTPSLLPIDEYTGIISSPVERGRP